jgi:hypothetical protein
VSPEVAWRGLTCRSAAVAMAGCGLMWPCACGRWLPVWLPGIWLARLMFESQDPMRSPIASPAIDLTRAERDRACVKGDGPCGGLPGCSRAE